MDKEKKAYYISVIEAKDDKMKEVMGFNFGGHHDLAAMANNAMASGCFAKDKHAREFVLGMRLLHHAMKKNADCALFAEFAPQFEAFKDKVRSQFGCGCNCGK